MWEEGAGESRSSKQEGTMDSEWDASIAQNPNQGHVQDQDQNYTSIPRNLKNSRLKSQEPILPGYYPCLPWAQIQSSILNLLSQPKMLKFQR